MHSSGRLRARSERWRGASRRRRTGLWRRSRSVTPRGVVRGPRRWLRRRCFFDHLAAVSRAPSGSSAIGLSASCSGRARRAASPSESAAKIQADVVAELLATGLNESSAFRSSAPNFSSGEMASTWTHKEYFTWEWPGLAWVARGWGRPQGLGVARPPPATPSHPRPPRQSRPLALRLPCGHQVGAIKAGCVPPRRPVTLDPPPAYVSRSCSSRACRVAPSGAPWR